MKRAKVIRPPASASAARIAAIDSGSLSSRASSGVRRRRGVGAASLIMRGSIADWSAGAGAAVYCRQAAARRESEGVIDGCGAHDDRPG